MSTTVDYLLLRHSQNIYFEPNAIPQLPVKASKSFFKATAEFCRGIVAILGKLLSSNLKPGLPMALSKSPYAQIGVKGLY